MPVLEDGVDGAVEAVVGAWKSCGGGTRFEVDGGALAMILDYGGGLRLIAVICETPASRPLHAHGARGCRSWIDWTRVGVEVVD